MIYDKIITPIQLKERLTNKDELHIIDTREITSFLKPIDTAIHIPASKIIEKLGILPKEKPIILYCCHGVDSFFLMNMLVIEYGFTDVYSLKSGLEGWRKFIEG